LEAWVPVGPIVPEVLPAGIPGAALAVDCRPLPADPPPVDDATPAGDVGAGVVAGTEAGTVAVVVVVGLEVSVVAARMVSGEGIEG